MASIIRIKRSSGTNKPVSLNWGELGYVTGIGSYGGLNQYKDRVFLGDDGNNVNPIGGYYYASMMEHSPGAIAGVTNTRNSDGGIVVILDSSRKVDQWNVDNLRLDGNTFSSQNTDGDIVLDPNGTGEINIVDDTYLSFGNDKDVKLRYDELTDNRFEIEGADWNFANNVAISISDTTASTTPTTGALTVTGGVGFATHLNVGGNVDIDLDLNVDGGDITTNLTAFNLLNATATNINAFGAATALDIGATTGIATIRNATLSVPNATTLNLGATSSATSVNFQSTPNTSFVSIAATTNATTTTSGALRVAGGVGIVSDVYIGGSLNLTGTSPGTLTGTASQPLQVNGGAYVSGNLGIGTTNPTSKLFVVGDGYFSGVVTSYGFYVDGNLVGGSISGTNLVGTALSVSGISTFINGPVLIGGGTSTGTAGQVLQVTGINSSVYIGGNLGVGVTNPTSKLSVDGGINVTGDLNVDGGDVTSNTAALNLFNANVTTANVLGAATAIGIGSITGTVTINNPTVVGTQATQNLYNTVATNLNFAGAATALDIGATTGIATIRNATLSVPNATTLNLGATSSATSVNFQSTPNTSFVSIAATTNATTTTSGALRVAGGVGISSDVYIGGILNVTGNQSGSNLTLTGNLQVDGNTTLGNASGDIVTITGSINHTGPLTNTGGVTIDNIGISSNVISTRSGGGNILYIDPYPDGLSNEGLVVVKGSLQVDGTTTTVDSSSVTVNGAIISLGDVTSNRTVVVAVLSGVSTITLDSVVGINTGDIISGNAALPNSGLTTITAYDTLTKIVTITGTTSSGIASTTQLIVTHAYDTNTDRGIAFDYNTGVGLANQKTGFFGFDDSTGYFTYIPDASISNSVVTGTKGSLDIGALYLNFTTSGISTRGSAYFDTNGKLISTNSPEVGTASTSNLILTTNASNVPVWTDTLDGGTF